jgi:hypothetical protein
MTSDYQLGPVILKNCKPVAYYSHKLNSVQRNHTTIEKELLSIIATFIEFHMMLFGARIMVYTDHKNLTFHNLTSQHAMHWHNFLDEYPPKFIYIDRPIRHPWKDKVMI